MNKSNLFIAAHKLTKKVIKSGDDYRVTFGACLKEMADIFKNNAVALVTNIENLAKKLVQNGAATQWKFGLDFGFNHYHVNFRRYRHAVLDLDVGLILVKGTQEELLCAIEFIKKRMN